MESSLVAYADESILSFSSYQDYLMCATILDHSDLEALRNELRPLLLPGQIKLHWTDEGDKRRRQVVQLISRLESFQLIIVNRSEISPKTERYRRKCLETLYSELADMKIMDLILESRQESQNRKDIEHIVALQASGRFRGIKVSHSRGGDDPLLWIPDVVLGAFNARHRGEYEYWEALQDKVLVERKAIGSL